MGMQTGKGKGNGLGWHSVVTTSNFGQNQIQAVGPGHVPAAPPPLWPWDFVNTQWVPTAARPASPRGTPVMCCPHRDVNWKSVNCTPGLKTSKTKCKVVLHFYTTHQNTILLG